MRKFILFLTIVILASCSPQRRLARLLERYPLPEKVDTLYLPGEKVYKDTTIYRDIPGETVEVAVLVDVPINIPDTSLFAVTDLAEATAYLRDNVLGLELKQLDRIYEFKLDSAIRENTPDTVYIISEKVVTVEKLVTKPFYKNGFFILVSLILVGMILSLLFRKR